MAMTINTNVVSINSQRNLSLSGNSLGTTMQRLSSGLRVNSAKDDAAGLAIAERMNAQSRGLAVAARNANDGISLAQTTEGALGKVGDMLQRMRELAVQSSNATNSTADREALNAEVSQLRAEIDRVAKTTSFNGTKVLDGTFTGGVFQIGSSAGDNITVAGTTKATADGLGAVTYGSSTSKLMDASKVEDLDKELQGLKMVVDGKTYDLSNIGKASSGQERLGQIASTINAKTADTGVTAFLAQDASGSYSLSMKSEGGGAVTLVGFDSLQKAAGVTPATLTNVYETEYKTLQSAITQFDPDATDAIAKADAVVTAGTALLAKLDGYDAGGTHTGAAKDFKAQLDTLTAVHAGGGAAAFETGKDADDFQTALNSFNPAKDVEKHITARNDALVKASAAINELTVENTMVDINNARTALNTARAGVGLGAVTTAALTGTPTADQIKTAVSALQSEIDVLGLNISQGDEIKEHKGIDKVDISSQSGAWEAIKQIDSAIDQVNAARGDLGALQTRFEKTVENIDIQNENISAARGRIVDADFATETANLSRAQILQQAGTAMVAQANQLPQGVLSLLQ